MKKLEVLILSILATMFLIACNNAETPSQPQKYTIEYELNGGAWVADYDAPSEYTEGEEVNLPDAQKLTRTGYAFAGWYETESFSGNTVTTITKEAKGNKQFYAKWDANKFEINISDQIQNGTISSDKKLADAGEKVTLTIIPKDDYYALVSLSVMKDSTPVTVNGIGNIRSFSMPDGNVTVTATFRWYPSLAEADANAIYISFGEWPQNKLTGTVTVDETQKKTAGNSTYYKGSDNAWYAKHLEDYYKVEPIKWRVISSNYNETGKRLLLAEKILLYDIYYDGTKASNRRHRKDLEPNNYKESRVRAFLNGLKYYCEDYPENPYPNETRSKIFEGKGFLYGAFTGEEIGKIVNTNVINNARSTNPASNATLWNDGKNVNASDNYSTEDKVFLLSMQEATNSEYGFAEYDSFGKGNARIRNATEYAKDNITYDERYVNEGYWWLRSPYYGDECMAYAVNDEGNCSKQYDLRDRPFGIVPALCLE